MRLSNESFIYTFEHYNPHKVRIVFKCNVTDKSITPFRISNALVDDFVVNHKSASPSSFKSAHEVGVLNEKRCKTHALRLKCSSVYNLACI